MKPHSQKFIQKRKFYVMLPVLVIPFLTMFFWALGGGQGVVNAKETKSIGLNLTLPEPQFGDETNAWDKLSLYQKARRDSLKFSQAKKNDPYFRLSTLAVKKDTSRRDSLRRKGYVNTSLGERKEPIDVTEARVHKKLEELQRQIDNPTVSRKRNNEIWKPAAPPANANFQSDVDRLESMMLMMQDGQQEDEEMQEINAVLNKILDIQHPERVKNRLEQRKPENPGLYADGATAQNTVTLLEEGGSSEPHNAPVNGFYGLDEIAVPVVDNNAIKAEVYGNQTLVSGAVIKLVLLQDINLGGVTVPRNTFVFGKCALSGERLAVEINSIQFNSSICPVNLSVYDVDGLEGIYVPGAIARDAAKKSSNETLQDVQLNSLNPSLEVQAASAGIEAAKGMLTKKARLIQVTAKAGYKVFLVNNNVKSKSNWP